MRHENDPEELFDDVEEIWFDDDTDEGMESLSEHSCPSCGEPTERLLHVYDYNDNSVFEVCPTCADELIVEDPNRYNEI